MWFCQKCNRWYSDSVTILKHFESRHTTSSPSIRTSKTILTNPEPHVELAKTDLHVLKPTLAKLLKVKKKKNQGGNNGTVGSSSESETSSCTVRKGGKSSTATKSQVKRPPLPTSDSALPENVGLMHITNSKDSSSIDQVMIVSKMNDEGVLNKIRTYICKYCCRRFPNSELLQVHLKTHQGRPIHACHICGITAGTFSALMAHYVKHSGLKTVNVSNTANETKIFFREPEIKKELADKNSIACHQCKKQFTSKKAFNTHYCPPVSEKTEYICAYCREVTTTVEEYRDHIQSHSPSSRFACKYCSSKFGHKVQLQQHIKVCLKKSVKSPQSPSKRGMKSTAEKQMKLRKTPSKVSHVEMSFCVDETDYASSSIDRNSTADSLAFAFTQVDNPIASSSMGAERKKSMLTSRVTVKIENDPPSPSKSIDAVVTESEDDIHHRLRPKKAKVLYASDSSPENVCSLQPTRRSARLVNRKHMKFSRVSSDSDSEIDKKPELLEPPPSPVSVAPISPISPRQRSNSNSPKKEDIVKARTSPSRSPRSKAHNQRSPVSASAKKTAIRPKNAAANPRKTSPGKRRKKSRKEEVVEEESESNTLYCNQCSLIFRSVGSLKRHRKMHTGKPQFVCQFCGKFFYRRDIHRRHESNVHQGTAPHSFVCYYCKNIFNSSNDLKQHAIDAHSGRAAAPERIRRCTPKNQVKKKPTGGQTVDAPSTDITVKKEMIDVVTEKDQCSDTTNLSYDNAGEQSATFDAPNVDSSEDVIIITNNINKVPTEKPSKEAVQTDVPSSSERNCSSVCRELSPQISEREPTLLMEVNLPSTASMLNSRSTAVKDKEAASESIPSKDDNYSCSLCFTLLPERGTMMCTEPEVHKAVDWYQCLLCSVVGPKKKIQEHMLQHMTKIGTFIVNVHDNKFKDISDYANYANQRSRTVFKELHASYQSESREEGRSVCTLMEEVTCVRCMEIIIDFSLLVHHPCREIQAGTYSCFVKDCHFSSGNPSEFESHLKLAHYHALYSDNRLQRNASTSSFLINGCKSPQNVADIQILESYTERPFGSPEY